MNTRMKAGVLAALTLAGAVAAASPASAQYYYRGNRGISPGGAAAIGAIGGLALGAALASSRPAYGYGGGYGYAEPVYAPPPVYYAPRPVYYAPRPVYYAPRPVYVAPRVVYARPAYRPYYPRYAAYGPYHRPAGPGWGYHRPYRNW